MGAPLLRIQIGTASYLWTVRRQQPERRALSAIWDPNQLCGDAACTSEPGLPPACHLSRGLHAPIRPAGSRRSAGRQSRSPIGAAWQRAFAREPSDHHRLRRRFHLGRGLVRIPRSIVRPMLVAIVAWTTIWGFRRWRSLRPRSVPETLGASVYSAAPLKMARWSVGGDYQRPPQDKRPVSSERAHMRNKLAKIIGRKFWSR